MDRYSRFSRENGSALLLTIFKIFLILAALYAFLLSVGLMGSGFKVFGKDFARTLIETTSNPFVGLFVGILATALIQSSSTTTSMVVAFVAAGTLSVPNAVPIVMGANVGTAVTSTIVSMGHITRKIEFKRAFSAGTVHDMFNLLAVVTLLPIELATGYLETSAKFLSRKLAGTAGLEFKSPMKMITKPAADAIVNFIQSFELAKVATGISIVFLGICLLIISLIFLSKLLKSLVLDKLHGFFQESLYANGIIAIFIGMAFTAVVQSSSVTTSLMIPLAAAGIMRLDQVFPVALGANVGTTLTALLAALATGNPNALTIALVHFLFNVSGILLFFPIPIMRKIPLTLATLLAELAVKNRLNALFFLVIVYFLLPGLAVLIT